MIGADPLRPASLAARPTSELGKRVGSAIVMAAAALFATWTGGWPFTLLWLGAAGIVLLEWTDMSRVRPRLPILVVGFVALVTVAAALRLQASPPVVLSLAGTAVVVVFATGAQSRHRLWAASGLVYAIAVLVVPVYIRDQPALGAVAILWLFAVVWLTDIGGYFVGRAIGGPKLAPSISPGKTWSGFAGGLVAATISGGATVALAAAWDHPLPIGWPVAALVSALASVAGQAGDLGESAMKRIFAVKDSGHLIPGHGGLMDRLDGFVPAGALLALVLALSAQAGTPQ